MMKAFWVGNQHVGFVFIRASRSDSAKWFHPLAVRGDFETIRDLHAYRAPWLDGDGPARELQSSEIICLYSQDDEGHCNGRDPYCYEGMTVNREDTIKRNERPT